MTCKSAAVFAFQESFLDITPSKASKKISAPIAMAAPVRILVSVIADEVVDVRLLILALPEANDDVRDITRIICAYWYKRLALCGQCASHRALLLF